MAIEYKKIPDTVCESCGVEDAPLAGFVDNFKETNYRCAFCAESIGRPPDPVTKSMLSEMMHTLLRELKKP